MSCRSSTASVLAVLRSPTLKWRFFLGARAVRGLATRTRRFSAALRFGGACDLRLANQLLIQLSSKKPGSAAGAASNSALRESRADFRFTEAGPYFRLVTGGAAAQCSWSRARSSACVLVVLLARAAMERPPTGEEGVLIHTKKFELARRRSSISLCTVAYHYAHCTWRAESRRDTRLTCRHVLPTLRSMQYLLPSPHTHTGRTSQLCFSPHPPPNAETLLRTYPLHTHKCTHTRCELASDASLLLYPPPSVKCIRNLSPPHTSFFSKTLRILTGSEFMRLLLAGSHPP